MFAQNDANIKLDGYIRGGGVNGALRIESNLAGYTEIGVMNSSASHFITDRNMFLFNQKLKLKEALIFDSSSDASIEFGAYSIAKTLRIVSLLDGVDKSIVRGMVINSMGRIGIGTDTPTSELEVNGTINTNELDVVGITTTATLEVNGATTTTELFVSSSAMGNLRTENVKSHRLNRN